jgi:hypothetical protein
MGGDLRREVGAEVEKDHLRSEHLAEMQNPLSA